ncbi:putative metalloprotease CJM1_0395 family protein [Vogesella sp. EB]|uniref:putative metalloprotease CJM1_0395 family protein n=1 Tax=Vogesella sp. EB TaxID=1526735 RepID=UPI00069F9DD0|nr:putative metalloprotease CJM1_0395 family protein [Vogesella sp. EB]
MDISGSGTPYAASSLSRHAAGCPCPACQRQTATVAANVGRNRAGESLSRAEQQQLSRLQQRDDEVRRHEQAHLAASGGLARGGASYQYQTGPDGQRYAVAGEVSIEVSPGRTPQQTLDKARTIRNAALAPAQPSAQDLAVAQQAARMAQQAEQQLRASDAASSGSVQQARLQRAYRADEPLPSGLLLSTSA